MVGGCGRGNGQPVILEVGGGVVDGGSRETGACSCSVPGTWTALCLVPGLDLAQDPVR